MKLPGRGTGRLASAALGLTLALTGATPARSHGPFYRGGEPIRGPADEPLTIKLLFGDGIVFADPVRAVVVDAAGRLRAMSPLSSDLDLVCAGPPEAGCVAVDLLVGERHRPEPAEMIAGGPLEVDGRPQRYPEDMTGAFAFRSRPLTWAE